MRNWHPVRLTVTLRPCTHWDCGTLTDTGRCPEHPRCRVHAAKPSATARGYPHWWQVLSKRARELQPWCTRCQSTHNLSVDHSPEAWKLVEAGKRLTLKHFRDGLLQVLCAKCQDEAGAARGDNVTRPAVNPSDRLEGIGTSSPPFVPSHAPNVRSRSTHRQQPAKGGA